MLLVPVLSLFQQMMHFIAAAVILCTFWFDSIDEKKKKINQQLKHYFCIVSVWNCASATMNYYYCCFLLPGRAKKLNVQPIISYWLSNIANWKIYDDVLVSVRHPPYVSITLKNRSSNCARFASHLLLFQVSFIYFFFLFHSWFIPCTFIDRTRFTDFGSGLVCTFVSYSFDLLIKLMIFFFITIWFGSAFQAFRLRTQFIITDYEIQKLYH